MGSVEMADNKDVVYERGKLYNLSLNDLLADPDQPRKVIDAHALEELTASIRKHGILEPILFRQNDDGNLVIVAGERRIIAARKAGMSSVPAIYVNGNSSEISLIENLLRQDLTVVEEAEALQRLLEQQKYTHEQLSSVIGKARTTISDILLINRLPQELRNDCRGNRLVSKKALIDIARRKQERAMITAYNTYKEKMQTVARRRRREGEVTKGANFEALYGMVNKTVSSLNNCDAQQWKKDDHENFRIKLTILRDWIDSFLALPSSHPAKEEKQM